MQKLDPIKEAIAEDKLELARNLLRLLIEDYPKSSEVWYWASKAAVNPLQARAFLEKAVDLDPLNHIAANELRAIDTPQPIRPSRPVRQVPPKIEEKSGIQYASFSKRAAAFLTDVMIIFAIFAPFAGMILFSTSQTTFNESTRILTLLTSASIFVQAIYFAYFLTQRKGQTVGKQLMGIRVVKRDGTAIGIWDAILRTVIGYSLSNLVIGTGHLWMLSDSQSQTWHDMVADTIVIDA